jgi:hypothetical protein
VQCWQMNVIRQKSESNRAQRFSHRKTEWLDIWEAFPIRELNLGAGRSHIWELPRAHVRHGHAVLRPWHVDDHNFDSKLCGFFWILRSVRSVHSQHHVDRF